MVQARRADFDEWFLGLYPDALALARRIVGDANADDVATEAFTRALVRWDRVRTLSYRDAWLLRVATNLGIDVVRRRRPQVAVGVESAGVDDVEGRMIVVAALRRLSQRQRQAVALRLLGQYSERETAEVM